MKRILLFFGLLFLANILIGQTTQKDTVNVKPFEDLTLVTDGTVDTSDQFLMYDISAGLFSYRLSLGELLKKAIDVPNIVGSSQIVNGSILDTDISGSAGIGLNKLATTAAGRLLLTDSGGAGTWVSGTPGYGLTISGTSMLVDTLSASGLVSKSRLTNALDDVGGGTTETLTDILGWYNVTDYGAVPDDGTDDTGAIQTAIDSCWANGGGVVYFPLGRYNIDGALVTNVDGENPNSQIYIPIGDYRDTTTVKTIKLLGEVNMPMVGGGYISVDNPYLGVLLQSSATGSGTYPAVIAATPSDNPGSANSTVFVEIENIAVRVPGNEGASGPDMCGINLLEANQASLKKVRVDIDSDLFLSAEPGSEVFGIAMPQRNNGTVSYMEYCRVYGFKYGVIISEHANINSLECRVNTYAVALEGAAHSISINHLQAHWNKHAILFDTTMFSNNLSASTKYSYLNIDDLNIETIDNGKWYANANTAEIVDPGNRIFGRIQYHVVRSVVGEQNSDWNMTGGSNINALSIASGADLNTGGGTSDTLQTLQQIVADGIDTIDFNTEKSGYWALSLSATNGSNLTFQNPRTDGTPTYRIHFKGASNDTIGFPSNVYYYDNTQLGNRILTSGNLVDLFYDGSNYWASDTLGVESATPYTAPSPEDSVTTVAGLLAWYSADAAGLPNGSSVSSITDRSGNGYNLSQATSANQPTYVTNVINSKPVWRFDGTDDFINRVDSIPGLDSGNDFTIFVVAKQDGSENVGVAFSTIKESNETAEQYRFVNLIDTRTNQVISVFQTDGGAFATNYLSEQASGFKIICNTNDFNTSGGTIISYLGNTLQESVNWTYSSSSYANETVQLGAQGRGAGGGQSWLDGDIAEVIIYSGVLSSSDRTKVYNYLSTKYGL